MDVIAPNIEASSRTRQLQRGSQRLALIIFEIPQKPNSYGLFTISLVGLAF